MKNYILIVNDEMVDNGSKGTLDVKLNNQNFDPILNKSVQSEYSFSFELPATPKNCRILNYADNLSRRNKFNYRYPAKLYVEETLIFEGNLIVKSYNPNKKTFSVNLVLVKVYDPASIFGSHVLSDLVWEVDYQGADTINAVNANGSAKYKFPFVSYGKFQKVPYFSDDAGDDYTSNLIIDHYNKFWHNSFPPSLNVLETMKRLYEQFGGYSVGGSAFNDPYLSSIYMSYNISDEQKPVYNLGNEKFGRIHIQNGIYDTSTDSMYWTQSLNFPYRRVVEPVNLETPNTGEVEYNFSDINVWNILGNGTIDEPCYAYDPDERVIIIPADGWYEISLQVSGVLDASTPTFQAAQWYANYASGEMQSPMDADPHMVTFTKSLIGETPIEIQLVKNYDDNIELIKGRKNVEYYNGDPTQTTINYNVWVTNPDTIINKSEWETDFPHQALYCAKSPTVEDNTTRAALANVIASASGTGNAGSSPHNNDTVLGYMHQMYKTHAYDPIVNPNFICGFSTMDNGQTVSVIKDGYGWDRSNTAQVHTFANVDGMERIIIKPDGTKKAVPTNMDKNEYNNAGGNYFSNGWGIFNGRVRCCVYLEQNDKLELMAVQRDFDGRKYGCQIAYDLDIRAVSPKNWREAKNDPNFAYGMDSEFSYNLNLGNFLNNQTEIASWVEDIKNAFNLTITQNGNLINIDTNKAITNRKTLGVVNFDDKVNIANSDISVDAIDWPKRLGVEWNINTEEYGYELTVPDSHINDSDWADWGDKGNTIIELDNTIDEEEDISTVNFSYNWFCDFTYTLELQNVILPLSVIALSENMIDDRHDANDTMSKDGFSLTQRFWYVQQPTQYTLPLASNGNEEVYISNTTNELDGFHISFKNDELSLFNTYYNGGIINTGGDYVKLQVYLSADEYQALRGGSLVKFDRDLYYCQKIEGFSPGELCTVTLYK